MDDPHLRAVIRAALRANGFDVAMSELGAADRRMRVLGLRLRDQLMANLPSFADRADLAGLADEVSFLWNRLSSMLAFGQQQAVVFRQVIHPGSRGLSAASRLPVAVFSAGISVLDYLADALSFAGQIFDVLDEATVRALFGSGTEAGTRLRRGL